MITFTNTFKDNVLDSLNGLIRNEFTDIQVTYNKDFNIKGTQFFQILPASDELEENRVSSEIRRYSVIIRYIRRMPGDFEKHSHLDPITMVTERVKRLIRNNTNYTASGTYKWHDGILESVDYQVELDDVSPDFVLVDMNFACMVEEVFS